MTAPAAMTPMSATLATLKGRSLVVGGAGVAAALAGLALNADRFFQSWLFAWVFWMGVSLGCLAILMIQHVTGGAWGLVLRRLLEAGTRTIPAMALLFVPLLFGLPRLYEWARPEAVAADPLLQHKAPYLNPGFFTLRAVAYFAVWSALALILNRWSARQDETGDPKIVRRFQLVAAPGLLLFVLTMTFASVDWVMSLEPHWFSTIYGVLLMAGQAVAAFCFILLVANRLSGEPPLSTAITTAHVHDFGKLLFAFVMVWAYFALSQFLIIWGGNLPEEIPWYLRRLRGGWEWVGLSIILLHFSLPFILLLMRRVKQSPSRLFRVALLILVMRAVDLYWMMAPAFGEHGAAPHWLDLAAFAGVGGLFVHMFAREAARRPLLPANDPYLPEALSHGHA